MSRIKKRGLDYFPVDIGFMNDRLVRRIMKREGEGALATLMCAFSCIYGGRQPLQSVGRRCETHPRPRH